jgi:hypothetical protein
MHTTTKTILFTFLLSALAAPLWAQGSYTAASCNLSDVQAAINRELAHPVDGDIISIPSGTCTWSGTTMVSASFTKSVTIQGAGAVSSTTNGASTTGSDATIIYDHLNHGSASSTISIDVGTGKSFRITGIALLMDGSSTVSANGMLAIAGTSASVRVDHCHFYFIPWGAVGLRVNGSVTGVADHNYFDAASGTLTNSVALHNGSTWNGGDSGDGSWADTDHFGTSQFFFVEDCRFHNGDMGDAHEGARYVLRHNTVTVDAVGHGQMFNHGVTSARGRGTRAAEVYQNNFVQPGTTGSGNPAYSINSGTALIWGNTITQYRYGITIDYTRKDNGTYPYGTTPGGWGNCNGTTGTAWDEPSAIPCLDAPARGAGDLLSGNFPNVINQRTGNIAWPRQALSPIYYWSNNYTPSGGYSDTTAIANISMFVANKDFYQQTTNFNGTTGVGQGLVSARPSTCTAGAGSTPGVGYWATDQNSLYVCTASNTWTAYYTPYTYPHPLTVGSQAGTTPLAPTNLVTTVH